MKIPILRDNFYRMSRLDWLFAIISSYFFYKYSLNTFDLIGLAKDLMPIIGTLIGFILAALTLTQASIDRRSLKHLKETKDCNLIFTQPIWLMVYMLISLFTLNLTHANNFTQSNLLKIIVFFFLIKLFNQFLRYCHLLLSIFKRFA